jgi:LacI family transcriptional regulator
MRSKLTDIAREAGVSTATVDRVLNNRDGVRERTREIVTEVAKRLQYVPEDSGGSLISSKAARIDFVIPLGTNAFMKELIHRLREQGELRPSLDVRIHTIEGIDVDGLAKNLLELRGKTEGVGVIALDHPAVRDAIRQLSDSGVHVVTIASDILHVPRIAYIGIDNRQAGRLAGFILGKFLNKEGPQKVALFAGSLSYRGHEEREMGFRHIFAEAFPNLQIVELREMLDDREKAFQEASTIFERYGDIAGIYNIGAGNLGIAKALKAKGRDANTVFIGHDATESNNALLLDGTMDAVIDQNSLVQAREALNVLQYAINKKPYVPHLPRVQVVFRENIPAM